MTEVTKRYRCVLPTNGHEVGDEVFLTDAEVANANGGETEQRFVLAEDQSADATRSTNTAVNVTTETTTDDTNRAAGQAANDQAQQQQGDAADMSGADTTAQQ